jgi:hypothetical protein
VITIARLIVRCYPRSWRERYADEVLAMLEASRPPLSDLADLGADCLGEWVRAGGSSLRHPVPAGAIDLIVTALISVACAFVVRATGRALASQLAAPLAPETASDAAQLVVFSCLGAILVWGLVLNLRIHVQAAQIGIPWPRFHFLTGRAVLLFALAVGAVGVLERWSAPSGPTFWLSTELSGFYFAFASWGRGFGPVSKLDRVRHWYRLNPSI